MENRFALLELGAALIGISLWFTLVEPAKSQAGRPQAQVSRQEQSAGALQVKGRTVRAAAGVGGKARDREISRRGNAQVRK